MLCLHSPNLTRLRLPISVLALVTASFAGVPENSFAWSKRGHATVGSVAAYLLADQKDGTFLKSHAFDMSFYNNVPDIVWKSSPEMYKLESTQHFADLEIFEREVKKGATWSPDRLKFKKDNPTVPENAGWAFWRISEIETQLASVTAELKKESLSREQKQKLQGQWLTLAGTLGHYVADLANPLHCTENYDGQATDQKGIHSYFEEAIVDELHPQLELEVLKRAKKRWAHFHKTNGTASSFDLARQLCNDSFKSVKTLLEKDKKLGRDNLRKSVNAYRSLIYERLAVGSLYLAEIWSRHLGWTYDGTKFYFFNTRPEHIAPPK